MSFARKTASDFFKDEEPSVEIVKKEESKEKIKNENEKIIKEIITLEKTENKVSLDHSKDKEQGVAQSVTETLENSKFTGYTQYQPENPSNLISQLALTPEQAQYHQQQQYIQQCQQYNEHYQQYQQYYAQYYNQAMPLLPTISSASTTAPAPASDPAYEFFTTSTTSTIPSTTSYDSTRASRQLTSYFDPTKFHSVLSPEMQALQQIQKNQQQAKLTGKEIEAFRKRKIEKKKAKNKWLYE